MEFLAYYQNIINTAVEKYAFNQEPKGLYEPMNYILSHSGKRVRPMMLLMANDLFGGKIEDAIKPALAMEFFHNFTLIHDDVMDQAPLRRNKPTIHTLYGLNTAILSGDGLLLKAYSFFADLPDSQFKKCVNLFTETGILLCEGQQYDVDFETKNDVTFQEYIQMISYKTGVLVSASFEMGAIIASASEQDRQKIKSFGENLGIAFQIMDDYLDVFGNQEKLGKKQAGDIFENKKTILYLLAKEKASENELKELDFWYSKKTDNVDKIYGVEKIFRRAKVDEQALFLVHQYSEKAKKCLDEISLPEEKKASFVELLNFLLKRES